MKLSLLCSIACVAFATAAALPVEKREPSSTVYEEKEYEDFRYANEKRKPSSTVYEEKEYEDFRYEN